MTRVAILLLIALVGCLGLADAAFADPPDPEAEPATSSEPASSRWTQAQFEEVMTEKPAVLITSMVLKIGPLILGLILLVLLYLQHDRIKGGMRPAPVRVTPTVPASGSEAIWLCLAAFLIVPLALQPFVAPKGAPLEKKFILLAIAFLPVAFLIVFRRQRLAPKAPGIAKGTALGFGTFCLAIAVVVPVSLVWVLILSAAGHEPQVQDLVQRAVQPVDPQEPYYIATYGVFVAPFAEEAIFRGMLYPLGRRLLGGNRRAAITSAVITSAMFAVIHQNVAALVPLFVLALVLTWAFERTNSLATVVVAHSLNNLTSLLPLLLYHWL